MQHNLCCLKYEVILEIIGPLKNPEEHFRLWIVNFASALLTWQCPVTAQFSEGTEVIASLRVAVTFIVATQFEVFCWFCCHPWHYRKKYACVATKSQKGDKMCCDNDEYLNTISRRSYWPMTKILTIVRSQLKRSPTVLNDHNHKMTRDDIFCLL